MISDSLQYQWYQKQHLHPYCCSPRLNLHLMFAGCMAVQSSARPCVLPGPSGAARRSPHHPWDQERCCADPPVCPGPVRRTIIVWHYFIFLKLYLHNCISCAQTVLLTHKHLHTIFTGASIACLPASWESYHTVPPLVRGLDWALVQVFSQRRVALCSL